MTRRAPGPTVFAIVVLLTVALSSCVTWLRRPGVDDYAVEQERLEQQKLAVQIALERQGRAWKVGRRISLGGADLCGTAVRYSYGFIVVARDVFPDEAAEALTALGIENEVLVWDVLDDGPAGDVLQKGDRIIRVNGRAVEGFDGYIDSMHDPFEIGQVSMWVASPSGDRREVALRGDRVCEYPVGVIDDDAVNAMADGKRVFVTSGMARFAASDDELALVVGHEIAHNVLGHVTQLRAQTAAGVIVDLAVAVFSGVNTGVFTALAQRAFSQQMEADADYMGLYLAARGGYHIGNASTFWRRMAVEHPGTIENSMLSSHPSSPERAVMLDRTVEEIEAKRAHGELLNPRAS